MKINILYCFIVLFALSFASCDKEMTFNDQVTMEDPPTEIEYPVATGYVTGQDGVLEGSVISVFQNGVLKGQTTSDDEGAYSTIEIETEVDQDLILVFEKEKYSAAYRKRSGERLKSAQLSVQLLSEDSFFSTSASIANPDSDNFISLSGYVKDVVGDGGSGFIAVEWMDGTTSWASTSATDDNGYYELLVGRNTELRVSMFSDTTCFDYLTEEDVTIFMGLQAEVMGPFDNDVVLEDYTNASGTGFQIGGDILQCGGGQSDFMAVEITITDNDGNSNVQTFQNMVGGQFSVLKDECISLPYTISIVGRDEVNHKTTDTLVIDVTDAYYTNENIQLEACNDVVTGFSTVVMTIAGVDYTFNEVVARLDNGTLLADSLTYSYSRFSIPNVMLGQNNIYNIDMASWNDATYFKAVNDVMPCNVTALTSNSATVIVSGDFVDGSGATVNGTCTLNLNY